MLKKLLSTLLSTSMLIQGVSLPVFANGQEPEIEEMDKFEEFAEIDSINSSYVTEKEEFSSISIRTPEDWQKISNDINANYILEADLDFSDFQWTQIKEFKGSLNGNGHKIKNFTSKNGGLFASNYGTIENLTLENAVVEVEDRTTQEGGIIVDKNYGIITRCTVKNSEIAHYSCRQPHLIGGIAGINCPSSDQKPIIEYCFVVGSKISGANVGGIVGRNSLGSILYCQSQNNEIVGDGRNDETGSATNGASAGGIVGISSGGIIDYCYCDNLNFDYEKSQWCGYAFFGGIAGLASGDISNCYSKTESSYFGSYANRNGYNHPPAYGNLVGANSLNKISKQLVIIHYFFGEENNLNIVNSYGDMKITDNAYEEDLSFIDEYYSNLEDVSISPSNFSQQEIEALKDDILSQVNITPDEDENNSNGSSTTITIPGQVTYYGANTSIQKAIEDDIKSAAKDFVDIMDKYLDAIETSTSKINENKISSGSANNSSLLQKGKNLRAKDEKSKTKLITTVCKDSDALDAAYSLLALYFEEVTNDGIEAGNVNFKEGKELKVSWDIFKEIFKSFGKHNYVQKVNGYTVSLFIRRAVGTFWGSVTVSKGGKTLINYAPIVSELETIWGTFNSYISTLSQWTKDALWSSFTSYTQDLGKITGISALTKNKIERLFKDRLDALTAYGYGSIMTYFYRLQKGYDLVKKIIKAEKGSKKLIDALKNGEEIYDALVELKFSYNASQGVINDRLVQQAMNAVENAKKELTKKLKEYLDNKVSSSVANKTGSVIDYRYHCPIDLSVLNENGVEIISIKDGLINNTTEYLVEVKGDAKHIRLPQDFKGNIYITPNGTGSMDCVVEKIENDVPIDRSFYQNLPVDFDISYTQVLNLKPEESSKDLNFVKNTISTNAKETISPTTFFTAKEDKAVEIKAQVIGNGQVEYDSSYSDNRYPIGQFISLLAIPDETTEFIGWYQETPEGEVLLELSSTLSLLCTENKTVKAVFEKIKDEDNSSTPSLEPMDPKPSTPSDNNNSSTSSASKPSTPVGGSGSLSSGSSTVQKNEMYRLYNPNSGEHFYTADTGEKDHLISVGWDYEGLGWNAPKTSNTPVYRLYNENAGDHHYTTDKNEKDTLVRIGWKDEKIGWYSDDQKGVPLYRVYNPNAQAGSHHYTTDKTEQDYLVGIGWNNEGVAWYGMK